MKKITFTNFYGDRREVDPADIIITPELKRAVKERAEYVIHNDEAERKAAAIQAKAAAGEGDLEKLTADLIGVKTFKELVAARLARLEENSKAALIVCLHKSEEKLRKPVEETAAKLAATKSETRADAVTEFGKRAADSLKMYGLVPKSVTEALKARNEAREKHSTVEQLVRVCDPTTYAQNADPRFPRPAFDATCADILRQLAIA